MPQTTRQRQKCSLAQALAAPQLLHYICQANWRPSVTQPTVGRNKILYSQTTHNCNCPKVALRKKANLTFSQLFRFQQILIFDADLSLCRAGIPLWDFNLYNSHVLSFPNGGNIWLALSTGSGLGAGSPKYPLITVIQGSYVNCPASGDFQLGVFLYFVFCICCFFLYSNVGIDVNFKSSVSSDSNFSRAESVEKKWWLLKNQNICDNNGNVLILLLDNVT